jgi:hypothetical protein
MARSKSRNIADLVQGRGNLTLNSNNISAHFTDIDFLGTGSITLPSGSTAQRDTIPAVGMIRFNTTLGVFEGYRAGTWSEIGGGSSDTWTTDNFTGNGSTAAYTLTQAPSSEDNVIAFIEGVFQNPADFVVSGTTITFDENIPTGQKVVVHSVKATVAGNNLNVDAFTGNGSNTQFTLSINPIDERNSMVYLDGVYQNKDTYSISSNILNFSTAPASSADIEVLCFTQTSINAPTSNSVGTASLIDDSVTSPKLGHALTLQGNTIFNGSIQTENISIPDNYALRLGSSQDLQIYHTGGFSVIKDAGSGDLEIQTNGSEIQLTGNAGTDYMARFISNGAVKLYHDNVTKFETTSTGVTANGIVTATTFSGDLNGTINTATTATTQANSVANTTIATTAHVTNKITQGTISPSFSGTPTAPTAANTVNTTQLATTAFVSNKITELIGGAPSTLNDLNELAAAINDDANYNSTLTTALATKLPLAGGEMSGTLNITQSSTNDTIKLTRGTTSHNNMIKFRSAGADKWILGQRNDSTEHFRLYSYGTSTDVLSILTDGKVGLGTTSPGNQLHLKHVDGPTIQLTRTSTQASSGNIGDILFGNADWDSSMARIGARQDGTNDGARLEFSTQSTAAGGELVRMIIHRDGQLKLGYQSIGGSVGTAGVILSDGGRNSSLGTTLGDTQRVVQFHNLSQNQDYLTFRTRRITDGNSGWNHAVWDITRDIDNTSDLYRYVTFGIGDVVINDFGANMDFRVESNTEANMLFVDGGTNKVGIATNAPANTLDVNGGATIRDALRVGTDSNDPGEIYIADASTTAYTLGIIGTGTRTFEFRGSSSGADYNTSFTNPDSTGAHNVFVAGSFEVNHSTSYAGLHLRGSNAPNVTFAQNSSTTPTWKVGISGNNGAYFGISSGTVNQDRITITDGGAVGIGDYTPSHKLDVNGVIGIKGNAVIDSDGTSHYFKTPAGGAMYFYHGTANIMYVSSAGLLPGSDNARDLGSTSNRWRNLYTTDLHLSNEGKPEGNQVDGTTGNWTIQEGEENLYIINNKSGKKYKFALEEIT